MGWRPKSSRALANIGKQNIRHTRRKVGQAWRFLREAEVVLVRLRRTRPLTPLSQR